MDLSSQNSSETGCCTETLGQLFKGILGAYQYGQATSGIFKIECIPNSHFLLCLSVALQYLAWKGCFNLLRGFLTAHFAPFHFMEIFLLKWLFLAPSWLLTFKHLILIFKSWQNTAHLPEFPILSPLFPHLLQPTCCFQVSDTVLQFIII